MSNSELDHLVKMANQIASNIGLGGSEEDAVSRTANHIGLYWARPMREKMCANIDAVGDALNPIARKALTEIRSTL
jgi:hypothetical protein